MGNPFTENQRRIGLTLKAQRPKDSYGQPNNLQPKTAANPHTSGPQRLTVGE